MSMFKIPLALLSQGLLIFGLATGQAAAQVLFFDDFEDRAADQALIGNSWTWFDHTFGGNECTGEPTAGYGPYDDGNGDDYVADNRNYWTADVANGGDGNYYRAGLAVPAWDGAFSNMLRVYGNVYQTATSCQRTLIFQEMTIERAGVYEFSYDVVHDETGDPANGETVAAFIKVLIQSDGSYEEAMFETVDSDPPDAGMATRSVQFILPEEYVGELLQFGFLNDLTPDLGQSWDKAAALYDNVTLEEMVIGPAHSGSFYNTAQSGHGFSVEFGTAPDGTPLAVIYWYLYDDMGHNVFLLGTGTPVGNRVEVTFESVLGMRYGVWDKTEVEREGNAGQGVFTFIDRDNALFSYTPSNYAMMTFGHTSPVEDLPLIKLFGIPADRKFMETEAD